MKYCLVIGSNSFSGANFVNFILNKKIKVIGVSRSKELNKVFLPYKYSSHIKNFKFYKININKHKELKNLIKIIKTNNIKHIINFSSQGMVGESWITPLDWYQTNSFSQIKLFEYLKNLNLKRYMHVTTPEVYGNNRDILYENTPFNPSTPYAISRSTSDFHLKALYKNYKFPVIFSRAANVYGPGQQLYRIIPKLIMSCKKNIKIDIHGGGHSKRSFVYIDDVNDGYYKIFTKGKLGNVYHLSSKKFISIKNLSKKVIKLFNKKEKDILKLEKKDRKGKDYAYFLNSNKIRRELKWKDKIDLDLGLLKTIQWINKNYPVLKKIKLNYKHKK